jgi:iron complex outermembrane receptor protein
MFSIARGDIRVAGVCVRASWRIAWVLLLAAQPAFAQSRGINGVVRDPQQAVVAGAEVVLISSRPTVKATALTDGLGRYSFAPPAPDTYVVEVHAKGFKVIASEAIALAAGESVTRDFVLALAGTNESVTVTGVGDVEQGYRVATVSSLGSSGPELLLDTPYTVSVLPSELINNAQVKNFKEATKFLPLMEFQEMQGSEIMRPATRGLQGSNMQNTRMDGMGIVITGANSLETVQQIEVLNGLGGAMYGPANPSGMFNFVPKRPTEQPRLRLALSYDNQAVGTIHADVGGRIGSGRMFGYRANLLAGDGETFVKDSRLARRLVSVAADARPFDRTVIEGFYSYYNLIQRGFPGWFTYGRANNRSPFIVLPSDAPDPSRPGYGQRDAGLDLTTRIGQLRVKHDINSSWRFGVGALDQLVTRNISTQVNALTDNAGNYSSSLAIGFAPQFRVFSNLGYVNGRFATGRIRHDVAVGSTGYTFKSYSDFTNPSAASVFLGTASIANPLVFSLPAAGLPTHDNIFRSSVIHQQGFNVSDTARFSEHWSLRIAASQDWIWTDNYNNRGVRTSGYRANGVSPSGSLLYKPVANMTVYGNYGSSLQQGDVAPTTVANAGQALPPYRSKQAEVGYKIAVSRFNFSTAVFWLERPFANTDPADNVFKISGDQVNYGTEATLSGRLTERVVVYGGLTMLDTNVTKTGNPATDHKRFVGIPGYKSSLLTEYQLPVGAGTFLSLTWQTFGRRPIDDINSAWTPAYNVVDLAMRYSHTILNRAATWKIGVNNVSDVHYWSTLGPGNITGTNVGSYTGHLGAPRTVAASMEVAF